MVARSQRILLLLEWIAISVAFLMPLVFWPRSSQPFTTAKEWLLAAWIFIGFSLACAGGLWRRRLPSRAIAAAAVWITAVSLSAGTGDEASIHELIWNLLPCAGFLLLLWTGVRPQRIVCALIFSGMIVALIALLQFAGWDPFLLLNLTGAPHESTRMRIFSTAGNPNFVAALLTALLPLTLFYTPSGIGVPGGFWRFFKIGAALIFTGAIIATGSRAPIVGFVTMGIWFIFRKTRFAARFILAGLAICAVLLLLSPARPIPKTVSGRIYIWSIIGAHLSEIPFAGYGPGAFPLRFAAWETEYIRAHPDNLNQPFFGLQDHAHNEYVEFLVDYGIVGLAAFIAVIVLSLSIPRSKERPLLADGIEASVIALLAIAIVDFPLHRPAELYLFWTQLALFYILSGTVPLSDAEISSA
jgi:putative inorganic carbon (hco3(-)) transporter